MVPHVASPARSFFCEVRARMYGIRLVYPPTPGLSPGPPRLGKLSSLEISFTPTRFRKIIKSYPRGRKQSNTRVYSSINHQAKYVLLLYVAYR